MFCDVLKSLRKERGLSRQQVADILGVSKRTIESYEYGNREPNIEMLCKLADFYGVSIDYLLGRTGYKEPVLTERDKAFLKAYESSPMRDAINTLLNIKSKI